jgi:hypothetical protein
MVEISKSGSGEGPGAATNRGYSTRRTNEQDSGQNLALSDDRDHGASVFRSAPSRRRCAPSLCRAMARLGESAA